MRLLKIRGSILGVAILRIIVGGVFSGVPLFMETDLGTFYTPLGFRV